MTAPVDTAAYVRFFRRSAARWERFWFAPVSMWPVAVFRMLVGAVVVLWATLRLSDAPVWLAATGTAGVGSGVAGWLLHDPAGAHVAVAVLGLAGVALSVGWKPRWAAAVCTVLLWLFIVRNGAVFNSGDRLLMLFTMALVAAPTRLLGSADAYLSGHVQLEGPAWIWRMVQLQMTLLYAGAAISKLFVGVWQQGDAVGQIWMLEQFHRVSFAPSFADLPVFVAAATFGTLAVELLLAVGIWWPSLRPWVLAAGLCMHLMIDVTMVVGWFSIVCVITYPLLAHDVTTRTLRRWTQQSNPILGR